MIALSCCRQELDIGFQAPSSASSASFIPVSCGLWLNVVVSGNIAEPVVRWPNSGSLNSSGGEKRRSRGRTIRNKRTLIAPERLDIVTAKKAAAEGTLL